MSADSHKKTSLLGLQVHIALYGHWRGTRSPEATREIIQPRKREQAGLRVQGPVQRLR